MSLTVVMGRRRYKRIACGQDDMYRVMCNVERMTEPHDRLKAARERAGYTDATSAAKAFAGTPQRTARMRMARAG